MRIRFIDILSFLPLSLVFLISLNNSFFWDTTHLASAQANWFFENGLYSLYLPDSIDSGHPPLTGWLLALCWKIFGIGLVQSHLFMLPFLVLLCIQWRLILRHYFRLHSEYLQLFLFLNPYLLGQAMLVSPDIILLSGFGLFLHGILTDQKWKMIFGSIILSLVSLRGMSCNLCLVLFALYLRSEQIKTVTDFIKFISLFIPSAVLAVVFLMYHYFAKGWIGFHAHSPWVSSFEKVDFSGFLKNILIASWRFCDQGLVFLWIFPLWVLYKKRKFFSFSKSTIDLFLLFLILSVFLLFPQMLYKQLLMHRYFIPLILVLTLIAISLVVDAKALTRKYIIIVCLCLMSGFFWIYPDGISKGWDAMPLHFPYYQKRQEALQRITDLRIEKSKIGASFPYNLSGEILDLSNDKNQFSELDFNNNQYILFSNVSNDFDQSDIHQLNTNWEKKFSLGSWPVVFILYERRDH